MNESSFIAIALIAALVVLVIVLLSWRPKVVDGMFIIDDTDPDTTRWTLEMKIPPEELVKKKRVSLGVTFVKKSQDDNN